MPGLSRPCNQGNTNGTWLLFESRNDSPVHMIRLAETREITPGLWVHPDEAGWGHVWAQY